MCDRWRLGENGRSGIECFMEDMGDRPSIEYTLDREDNSRGYEPGNCRWATKKEQARNTRANRPIVFFGEEVTVSELAERAGIDAEIARQRLKLGWSIGRAFSYRWAA